MNDLKEKIGLSWSVALRVETALKESFFYTWLSKSGRPKAVRVRVYSIVSVMHFSKGVKLNATQANLSSWNWKSAIFSRR